MKKKATSRTRASAAKTSPGSKTVDEYMARVPEPARSTLNKIRATIRSAVPAETAEVISYGIPAFKWKKMVVWYAAFFGPLQPFPDRIHDRDV